jgi:hypothetical protein
MGLISTWQPGTSLSDYDWPRFSSAGLGYSGRRSRSIQLRKAQPLELHDLQPALPVWVSLVVFLVIYESLVRNAKLRLRGPSFYHQSLIEVLS